MDGLPVTIRLIDPPLHEFLPDLTDLSVKVALAGDDATEQDRQLLEAVRRLHEQNPMLGLRGVRLVLVIPGLLDMQVRAIAAAAAELDQGGRRPQAGDHDPADRDRAGDGDQQGARREGAPGGGGGDRRPRDDPDRHDDRGAAGRAHRGRDRAVGGVLLLRHQRPDPDDLGASPGTTWRGRSSAPYIDMGIFGVSPFETIDADGVGRLVRDRHGRGPGDPAGPHSASAASTAATRRRSGSSTRPASTTCPARRSASRSPGWRRAGPRLSVLAATLGEWPTAHMTRSAGRPSRPSAPAVRISSVTARGSCTAPRCAGSPRKRR